MSDQPQQGRAPQVMELHTVDLEPFVLAKPGDEDIIGDVAHPKKKNMAWLTLLGSGIFGLTVIGLTLWAEGIVRTLIERQPVLGYVAITFVAFITLGLLGFMAREVRAVLRLRKLDHLREALAEAYETENLNAARVALEALVQVYQHTPETAQGRAQFAKQRRGVLDARDLIVIAEDSLMSSLDARANAAVSSAARRVSLVTALSPRALIDIAMVAYQCIHLTRQIAELYGARPGLLGGIRLVRHMMTHLAITGGIAATEGLVSQVLGHSLAARLSSRLGEGVINGLLTARVGIAAIAVTRPMPFLSKSGPTLRDMTNGMVGFGRVSPDKTEKTTSKEAAKQTTPPNS
ncbi:MAG: TIGR01620 family protein [Pseudomonadota bacterium]